MHRYGLALLIIASPFSSFAAELPKEGNVDVAACWSTVATNVIPFAKTHTATGWENTGTIRSTPPGGYSDNSTYRCVG
jgi:hypothetical protein